MGFVWVEYRINDDIEKDSSFKIGKETIDQITPVVQQKSLGFYLDTSVNSSGVGVGYRDVIVVVPAVNAESNIEYDTSDPLSSRYTVDKKD